MNTLKLRQVCFILAIFMPISKMVFLPSTISYYAKNDILISAIINIVVQAFIIFIIMLAVKKSDTATFYDRLNYTFGKVTAKIMYFIYSAFFIFCLIVPLLEHKSFVQSIFYETSPALLTFLPFFAVSYYASVKGMKTMGRIGDICLFIFALAFPIIIALSFGQAEFTRLMPVLGNPINKTIQGSLYTSCWYFDTAFLLFFMGHFKSEKHSTTKVMISYAVGALCTLLFLAVFYGIFSDLSVREIFGLSKMTKYYTALSSVGRADFIVIYMITIIMIFFLSMIAGLSSFSLQKTFNFKKKYISAIIINGVLVLIMLLLNVKYYSALKLITQGFYPVFILFQFIIPFFVVFLKVKKDE